MREGEGGPTCFHTLLAGTLTIEQPHRGHRAGTDAVLLSAAADIGPDERFADVGAGVGTVGLSLAMREPTARGVLVEADRKVAEITVRNIAMNGLAARVQVAALDLFDHRACRDAGLAGSADLVVTNPPFYSAGTVRRSPDESRAAAHVLSGSGIDGGHAAWVERCYALLGPKGRLVIIHRADVLPQLLAALSERLGDVAVKPVLPRADLPAIRVLIGARRGSKAPMRLLPPLVLHEADGGFSEESAKVHAGAALLSLWPKQNRPRRAGFT